MQNLSLDDVKILSEKDRKNFSYSWDNPKNQKLQHEVFLKDIDASKDYDGLDDPAKLAKMLNKTMKVTK